MHLNSYVSASNAVNVMMYARAKLRNPNSDRSGLSSDFVTPNLSTLLQCE